MPPVVLARNTLCVAKKYRACDPDPGPQRDLSGRRPPRRTRPMPDIPNPPWRIKSAQCTASMLDNTLTAPRTVRPCPFFSKGQCFFAEACNFVHDVKITAQLTQIIPSISYTPVDDYEAPSPSIRSASDTESEASPPTTVKEGQIPGLLGSPIKLVSAAEKLSRRAGRAIGPTYLEELKSYQRSAREKARRASVQEVEYAPTETLLDFSLVCHLSHSYQHTIV